MDRPDRLGRNTSALRHFARRTARFTGSRSAHPFGAAPSSRCRAPSACSSRAEQPTDNRPTLAQYQAGGPFGELIPQGRSRDANACGDRVSLRGGTSTLRQPSLPWSYGWQAIASACAGAQQRDRAAEGGVRSTEREEREPIMPRQPSSFSASIGSDAVPRPRDKPHRPVQARRGDPVNGSAGSGSRAAQMRRDRRRRHRHPEVPLSRPTMRRSHRGGVPPSIAARHIDGRARRAALGS